MLFEVVVDIAARSRKLGGRGSPRARVGLTSSDVRGNGGPREEPDGDGAAGPLDSIDAAADFVEARSKTLRVIDRLGTAGAAVASVAVSLGHGASGGGVKRHGCRVGRVNSFDNINLARVRPAAILAEHPKGGPETAALLGRRGHVSNVGDEETLGVRLLGVDTRGAAARVGVQGLVVRSEIDAAVGVTGERGRVGRRGGVVLDETIGGIRAAVEVESVKEAGGVVCVLDGVRCCQWSCNEGGNRAEAQKRPCADHCRGCSCVEFFFSEMLLNKCFDGWENEVGETGLLFFLWL